jgi:hypothetical protein
LLKTSFDGLTERDFDSGDNQRAIAQKLDGMVVAVNLGERSAPAMSA